MIKHRQLSLDREVHGGGFFHVTVAPDSFSLFFDSLRICPKSSDLKPNKQVAIAISNQNSRGADKACLGRLSVRYAVQCLSVKVFRIAGVLLSERVVND